MCITTAAVMIVVLAVIKNVGIGGEHYTREVMATAERDDESTEPRAESADAAEDSVERPDRES